MTLTAYWTASLAGGRYWFLSTQAKYTLGFVLAALTLAFLSEYSAVHYRKLWTYSDLMRIIPAVELGLTERSGPYRSLTGGLPETSGSGPKGTSIFDTILSIIR